MPINSTSLPSLRGKVLWLCPTPCVCEYYQRANSYLSRQFHSPPISPHITLGRLEGDFLPDIISKTLQSCSLTSADLTFDAGHIQCNRAPWQRFIHNLYPPETAESLQTALKEALDKYRPVFDYHISLHYGFEACDELQLLFQGFPGTLPASIPCSLLKVMDLNGPPEKWSEIWQSSL
ncbi:MAG: hypothetical protein R6V27_16205 [Balneolaceae bacterium]